MSFVGEQTKIPSKDREMRWLTAFVARGIVGVGLLGVAAQLATAQPAVQWTTYRNDSGTTVPFPADVFTVRAGEGMPRGEVITSADGRARMHVFTIANERNEGPAQFIARAIVDDPRRLTYQRVARDFVVFSAPENDRILYRRCNFASDRLIHCLDLRYPRAEKRAWDGVVTRMSLGLKPK
jgi:hypothetical protein